jgi:hypothetical protein
MELFFFFTVAINYYNKIIIFPLSEKNRSLEGEGNLIFFRCSLIIKRFFKIILVIFNFFHNNIMNLLPSSTKSRTIDQGLFGLLKTFKQ